MKKSKKNKNDVKRECLSGMRKYFKSEDRFASLSINDFRRAGRKAAKFLVENF